MRPSNPNLTFDLKSRSGAIFRSLRSIPAFLLCAAALPTIAAEQNVTGWINATLSGSARTFLTAPASHYYNGAKPAGWNESMEALEIANPNGVFPEGPRPYIAAFDPNTTALINKAADAGFTVCGPFQRSYDHVKQWFELVARRGMWVAGYMRKVGGTEPRWEGWKDMVDAGRLDDLVQLAKDV